MKIFLDLSHHACDVIHGNFFIELRPFRLCIEFSLENPKGGLHFVVPDLPGPAHENAAHVFTAGLNNCSRYFHALYSSYIHMTL